MLTTVAGVIVFDMNPTEVKPGEIDVEDAYIGGHGNNTKEYTDKLKSLQNYTFDQKCERGMDLGMGFLLYTPYVELGFGQSDWGEPTTIASGILPNLVDEMVKFCCPKSKITFGDHFGSISDVEHHFEQEMNHIDITYPIYGLRGDDSVQFKDFPMIPLVTAPKIVLMVPDKLMKEKNTRTTVLMSTIFNAWPMLIFICVSACLAGLIVWLLDKKANSDEFPPTFFSGAWEGIWWAFVTMTTVGYGDRSPKSVYARFFCVIWIILGLIMISLFTGLISSALSASATPVFNVPGAKIGAVSGSIEFQVGVGMNAEMHAYPNHALMLSDLITGKKLHAAIIDNFILSAIRNDLTKYKLRLERELHHPVTYGVALRGNSTKTEACFRKFKRHFPQKTFEIISSKLYPVKNPTDEISLEVEAAETLFYSEKGFKTIVYTETGLLVAALIAGIFWEYCIRNKTSAAYHMVASLRGKQHMAQEGYAMDEPNGNGEVIRMSDPNHNKQLDMLINEYDGFHRNWVERVKTIYDNKPRIHNNMNGTNQDLETKVMIQNGGDDKTFL